MEGQLDRRAIALAERFWPGPITLVVPVAASGRTSELARAGLGSIGLRVPGHRLARALLEEFGGPVSAPSANLSGRLSPTRAEDVERDLGGQVELVLDGGECDKGIESSIVAVMPDEPPRLLRPGAVSRTQLEEVRRRGGRKDYCSRPVALPLRASCCGAIERDERRRR
jgi:L-threonylcarbamoyladenylate synthase